MAKRTIKSNVSKFDESKTQVGLNIKIPYSVHKKLKLKAVQSDMTLEFMCGEILKKDVEEK